MPPVKMFVMSYPDPCLTVFEMKSGYRLRLSDEQVVRLGPKGCERRIRRFQRYARRMLRQNGGR